MENRDEIKKFCRVCGLKLPRFYKSGGGKRCVSCLHRTHLSHLAENNRVCLKCSEEELRVPNLSEGTDSITILQVNVQAETRAGQLYQKHLELTSDPNMKRMINFLIGREEVHKRLLKRAQILILDNSSPEEFNELIYDYKMSLQVLE